MKFKPRYYQQEAIDSVFKYFTVNTGNPIIAMPTGTGKSIVISGFLEEVYRRYPGQRIMMLTHVKELIEQNFSKLIGNWPTAPAGIYSAGLNRKESHCSITFAGIGSVAKKPELFGHIDLILIDECHLVSANADTQYRKFIAALTERNPFLKVIGLTATPYRLGQGELVDGSIFTHLCYDITNMKAFNRLVSEGYLAKLVPKRTRQELDVEDVKKAGGDYVQKELQKAVDKEEITYRAVEEIIECGQDRKSWLVFGTGIEHCENIVSMFESFGIDAVMVHSKMTTKQRDENLAKFKSGQCQVMVNNGVLTTGFDHPGIDLIAMLRPTQSPGLWVQMLGRGTRPDYAEGFDLTTTEGRLAAIANSDKPNCLVLDFAGNTRRLGPINDPVTPKKKKKGKKAGTAPVRVCEKCGTYNHASVKVCDNCGFEFPVNVKLQAMADYQELMRTDEPIVEEFKVDRVTYTKHTKRNSDKSTLRVTYYCGLKRFNEYVCFEHTGYAGKRAKEWYLKRFEHYDVPPPIPLTVEDAKQYIDWMQVPEKINVWINKKHPEIMSYTFSPNQSVKV